MLFSNTCPWWYDSYGDYFTNNPIRYFTFILEANSSVLLTVALADKVPYFISYMLSVQCPLGMVSRVGTLVDGKGTLDDGKWTLVGGKEILVGGEVLWTVAR